MRFKTDLAIVNRSFWPHSQVIGEGLLQFAEKVAQTHSVCVITQAKGDLAAVLRAAKRGEGVSIHASKACTTSASSLPRRIVDALRFMCWVLFSLIRTRPARVYVSTDPPVVVPFIVSLYCRLWRACYVYHLQDIHPEATNIVLPLNTMVFRFLRWLDGVTLRHADQIVTLSVTMRDFLQTRAPYCAPIVLIDNPAVEAPATSERNGDIVYCGNAGRLQRIPLLIASIREYVTAGGTLQFTFAGGGVYASDLHALAASCAQVSYLGVLPASDAAALLSRHRWALLPIDDEVTRYAFPSKSSSYVLSGSAVLAICGAHTSVAKWVIEHRVGEVCAPEVNAIVSCFFELECQGELNFELTDYYKKRLKIDYFSDRLRELVVNCNDEEII